VLAIRGRWVMRLWSSPFDRYNGAMKVREVIRLIESDGWRHVRTRGSHRQFNHPAKRGVVTVPGKPNDDLAPGTLNSVLKQAGLK
jgi:predicted RNA binding protein YcfA (HicA-like mRNA interferase family)